MDAFKELISKCGNLVDGEKKVYVFLACVAVIFLLLGIIIGSAVSHGGETKSTVEETRNEQIEGDRQEDSEDIETVVPEEKKDEIEEVDVEPQPKPETTENVIVEETPKPAMTEAELERLLAGQPLCVTSTKYVVQDERYKALYPDMLQAIIKNNTNEDIKDAVVAFVAWDVNNLPVKIIGKYDFSDGQYVTMVDYNDVNLIGGGSYGSDSGLALNQDCHISTFKAMAVSYETFEGKRWENPYFNDFCQLYEGKKR